MGNGINTGYDEELLSLTGHNSFKQLVQNKRVFVCSSAHVPVCVGVCVSVEVHVCGWRRV